MVRPDRAGVGVETGPSALDRVVYFSDAVFAIAITLLILPLTDVRLGDERLVEALLALWPKLLSFLISFLVIAVCWLARHRAFHYLVRVDRRFLMLIGLVLLCVAFLPFPTSVLGEHGNTTAAVVLYAASMSALGLSMMTLWRYASRGRRLVTDELDARTIRYLRPNSPIVPALYPPSIPVAFVSPYAATAKWLLTFPAGALLDRRLDR